MDRNFEKLEMTVPAFLRHGSYAPVIVRSLTLNLDPLRYDMQWGA